LEIRILKRTERELRIEVVGESHTLLNLLQRELVKDPEVEVGGYDVVHPLEKPIRSIMYIRTRGKKPEEALLEAVGRAREISREFSELFSRALEAFRGRGGGGHEGGAEEASGA